MADGRHVDGTPDVVLGSACGSTPDLPLRNDRGEVTVFVTYDRCGTGVSAPTTGTMTATFS